MSEFFAWLGGFLIGIPIGTLAAEYGFWPKTRANKMQQDYKGPTVPKPKELPPSPPFTTKEGLE